MTRNVRTTAAALAAVVLLIVVIALRGSKEEASGGPGAEEGDGSGKIVNKVDRDLPHVTEKTADAAPAPEQVECKMKPCGGPVCDKCVNENCDVTTTGCQSIADAADRRLCEDLYACFSESGPRLHQSGRPSEVLVRDEPHDLHHRQLGTDKGELGSAPSWFSAAAKTEEASEIRYRFLDPKFPLGRAANLVVCRGGFCGKECSIK